MLVKPCILFVTKETLGLQAAQKLERVPLSNDTVQRSIEDTAVDVEEQVYEKLRRNFSAVVIVFICFS